MWILNLTIAPIHVDDDVRNWVTFKPLSNLLSTEYDEDGWLNVASNELDISSLNYIYRKSPKLIQELLLKTAERSHTYLKGKYNLNPKSVYNGLCLLQSQKNFLVNQDWDPLQIKPFEEEDVYYKRLTTMISVQTVLEEVVAISDQFPLDWDNGISISYKSINLNVNSFVNALKHRERRKFIPLIKRLLFNSGKIRELRRINNDLILNNNLEDCK